MSDDKTLRWNMPDSKPGDPDYGRDFCNDSQPIWDYPTSDFEMPGGNAMLDGICKPAHVPELHVMSCGFWGACEECSTLIEAGNELALLERMATPHRAVIENMKRMGAPAPIRARMMEGFRANSRANYEAFTKHRTGPRVLTGHE
jgi:hypothetical protein